MNPNLHSMYTYIGTMNPQTHSPDTFAGCTILSYIKNEKCQICRFQGTIKELQVHSKCSKYIQNAPDTFGSLQAYSPASRHIRRNIQKAPDTFAETFKRLQTHSQRHSKGSRHIQKAQDTFTETFKRLQTYSQRHS